VDQIFKANRRSIALKWQKYKEENKDADELVWRKPTDFLYNEGTLKVFEGDIEPNDIKQGGLGDCYYLSSLSVLAEHKNLVRRIFYTKEYQPDGLYGIWLCVNGVWKLISLDNMFVCHKDSRGAAFSRSAGPELWVLLMEKAYAKINQCFANIVSG